MHNRVGSAVQSAPFESVALQSAVHSAAKLQIFSEIIYNQPHFYTLFNKGSTQPVSRALQSTQYKVMTDDSYDR